jgi:hypothetical protein
MESTGRPGRIQASEQTALELQAKGKHRWLKARKDHVSAKGLGELSTYWIELPKGSGRGSVSTDDNSNGGGNEMVVVADVSGVGRTLQSGESFA